MDLAADDGMDIFLTQAAGKMEEQMEQFEDIMLSQVADYLEHDYSIEQAVTEYLPKLDDFDLEETQFDLGYFPTDELDTKGDIKPAVGTESRFASVTEFEMKQMIENQKNKNTDQNTKWALGVFNAWRSERYPNIPELTKMEPNNMNMWLSRFVMEARKRDGGEYPGKSVYLICCGLIRHLKDNDININFLNEGDSTFSGFRKALDSKMKDLLSRGIGTTVKQAAPILPDDEEKIWESGVFGTTSSESLQHTMFFYCCKLFGLRGMDEHRSLQCDQFKTGRDSCGRYVQFIGRSNKTFKGGLAQKELTNKDIKHYCNEGPRCIADLFETYLKGLGNNGSFYRKPLSAHGETRIRYGEQPVGVNKLKTFMSTICKKAGLDGNYSNHSGKRTCATSLYQAGIDEQEIMSRTGHRSEKAVRKYKTPCAEVVKKTSSVLNPPAKCIKLEGSENVPTSSENLAKTDRKQEVRQKLIDISNRIGTSTDSMFFANCTFHL